RSFHVGAVQDHMAELEDVEGNPFGPLQGSDGGRIECHAAALPPKCVPECGFHCIPPAMVMSPTVTAAGRPHRSSTGETMLPESLFEVLDPLGAGRHDDAARPCQAFWAGDPEHAEGNHLLGVIRSHQGKTPDALFFLQRAISAPAATAE